jgi:hypothetical protein
VFRSKWQAVTEHCGKRHNEELRNSTPRQRNTLLIGRRNQEKLDVM